MKQRIKMKKRFTIYHILLIISILSLRVDYLLAQTHYTLEDCKRIAIENNLKLKNSNLEIQASKELKKDAFTNYFPTVQAAGMGVYYHHPMLAVDMMGMPVTLIDKGYHAGLTVTQPIFAGGKIVNNNKLAELGADVSQFRAKLTENEVVLNTECLYWQLVSLYEKERTIDLLDIQLDTLIKDVELAYKTGLVTNNDVLKVKLKKNELQSNRIHLSNGIKLMKMSMCQEMGIDLAEADNFEIDIPNLDKIESPINLYVNHKMALQERTENKLLDKNVEAAKLTTKIKRGDYLPTVAIGASYYGENMIDKWRSNSVAFVSVKIPLSDWWGGSHSIKRQRLEEKIAINDQTDSQEKMLLQMQNTKNELDNAYKLILVARDGVEQSTENLRLNNDYYRVGTVLLSDVLDAQTLLQQNRDKYVESYAEYQKKKIEYLQVTAR